MSSPKAAAKTAPRSARSMSTSQGMSKSVVPPKKLNPLQAEVRTPKSKARDARRSSKGSGDGRRNSGLSEAEVSFQSGGGGSGTELPAPLLASDEELERNDFSGSLTVGSDEEGTGNSPTDYEDEEMLRSSDDAYDPSLMWLVSRGTQCITPDVETSHPQYMQHGGAKRAPGDDPATNDFTVFCISVADYNARQHGLHIDDDADEDEDEALVSPSRRRVSYHSPAPAGSLIVRMAGRTYGFTDGQKSAKPLPAPWSMKGPSRATQTKDQRIFTRTVFAPKEQMQSSVTVNNPAGRGEGPATAAERSKARRRSRNEPRNSNSSATGGKEGTAAENKRVSIQGGDTTAGGGFIPQVGVGKDGARRESSTVAVDPKASAGQPTVPSAKPPAPGASAPATKSRMATMSVPKRAVSKGSGNATSALVVAVMQLAKEVDPSSNYQWIDGIGNVPRRDPFYDTLLQPKPRPRPSSAAVAAAMNQDDAAPQVSSGAATQEPAVAKTAREPGAHDLPTRRGSRADSIDGARSITLPAGSRRESLSDVPGSASVAILSPTNGSSDPDGEAAAGNIPSMGEQGTSPALPDSVVNMFEVEPRRLPPLPPNMRRALVPNRDGAFASNRANPWADTALQYDPTKLQPSTVKKKATPSKLVARPPPVTHSNDLHAIDSRKTSIPALGPDSALESSTMANSAAGTNSNRDGHAKEKPLKLPPAKHSSAAIDAANAAELQHKTQKQMLIDRDKEFAKLFPDWIANDDRYRPLTKQSARGSRR